MLHKTNLIKDANWIICFCLGLKKHSSFLFNHVLVTSLDPNHFNKTIKLTFRCHSCISKLCGNFSAILLIVRVIELWDKINQKNSTSRTRYKHRAHDLLVERVKLWLLDWFVEIYQRYQENYKHRNCFGKCKTLKVPSRIILLKNFFYGDISPSYVIYV